MRIVAPEVGGGFGSKLNVYGEEALLGFISMQIGKPVKWIESRRENCIITIHGRGHVDHLEIAAKKDGTILGLKIHILQDLGAYHQLLTPLIPTLSVLMVPGLYKFQTFRPTSPASSRTAFPPMRIAAPDVPKPPTSSSAWWTCLQRSSRWTRRSSASRTSPKPTNSRSHRDRPDLRQRQLRSAAA